MSCLLTGINAHAQNEDRSAITEKKVFPFISCLKNRPELINKIIKNPELIKLTGHHKGRIEIALKQCNDAGCYADALKWTQDETALINSELIKLSVQDKSFKSLILSLRVSGSYNLYVSNSDPEFISAVWNSVEEGVTHILDVYIKGKQPFYAAIDTISFMPDDEKFINNIKAMLASESTDMDSKAFFEVPVNYGHKSAVI
jgi:hypothetical protein